MRTPLSNLVVAFALVFFGYVLLDRPGEFEGFSYQTIGYGLIGLAVFVTVTTASRYKNFWSALAYARNPTKKVTRLVKSWKPRKCTTEKHFQKSLDSYLAEELPDLKIVMESGSSRIRADIEIEKDVIIELKVDLNTTAKLQRLLGQIQLYKKEFDGRDIILVLAGKADRNMFEDLEEAIDSDDIVSLIQKT